jgi:hypothetical protein
MLTSSTVKDVEQKTTQMGRVHFLWMKKNPEDNLTFLITVLASEIANHMKVLKEADMMKIFNPSTQ